MKGKKFLAFSLAATLLVGSSISVFAAGVKDVFNAGTYAGNYSDLAANYGTNASALLNHFLTDGAKEGRVASPILDVAAYRAAYADLNAAFGDDWDAYVNHYLTTGILEKRTSGVLFDLVDYANKNADVKAAFGNDYVAIAQHYVNHGINEKRPGGTIAKVPASTSSSSSAPAAPAKPATPAKPETPATTKPAVHEHTWELIGSTDANCTQTGVKKYICNAPILENNYDPDGNWIGTKPVLAADNTPLTCRETKIEVVPVHHVRPEGDENVYTEHATCQYAGKYVYTCTQCGASVTEKIDQLQHNYIVKVKVVKATSCDENAGAGYTVYKCQWCDATQNRDFVTLEHRLGGQPNVVSDATCTARGVAYGYCDMCAAKVTVYLPMLAHDNHPHTVYADTYLTNKDNDKPSHYAYTITACDNCKEIDTVTAGTLADALANKVECADTNGDNLCDLCKLPMDRNFTSQVKVYVKGEYYWADVQ